MTNWPNLMKITPSNSTHRKTHLQKHGILIFFFKKEDDGSVFIFFLGFSSWGIEIMVLLNRKMVLLNQNEGSSALFKKSKSHSKVVISAILWYQAKIMTPEGKVAIDQKSWGSNSIWSYLKLNIVPPSFRGSCGVFASKEPRSLYKINV